MNTNASIRWRVFFPVAFLIASLAVMPKAQTPALPRYMSGQFDPNDPTRVDVALVSAVDVSSSIKSDERRFQREAYATALSDPRVIRMALGGGSGRVAIAYMEWSGRDYQRVHLPIRVMSTAAELARFGQEILAIEDVPGDRMYLQRTAIGDALVAAEEVMAALPVPARDYVIDISGDGVLNDGSALPGARERLVSMGLTVNGLPIEVSNEPPVYDDMENDRVTRFYADCVIGGPGAFHVVARGFDDVRETLIMKLMLEMAQMPPSRKRGIAAAWNAGRSGNTARIIPATALQLAPQRETPRGSSDCGLRRTRAVNPFTPRN